MNHTLLPADFQYLKNARQFPGLLHIIYIYQQFPVGISFIKYFDKMTVNINSRDLLFPTYILVTEFQTIAGDCFIPLLHPIF